MFINCPLEQNDNLSPLEIMLNGFLTLNILELLLLIILFLVLFNKYIYKYNIEYISKLVNKYMPNKFIKWYKKI